MRSAYAQGSAPLKVGVLLPKSGVQAGLGQACQRGADTGATANPNAAGSPGSGISGLGVSPESRADRRIARP